MTKNIGVVIVEKTGVLKNLCIKTFSHDDYIKNAGLNQKKTSISIVTGVSKKQI